LRAARRQNARMGTPLVRGQGTDVAALVLCFQHRESPIQQGNSRSSGKYWIYEYLQAA
jgi:hypothetical protein